MLQYFTDPSRLPDRRNLQCGSERRGTIMQAIILAAGMGKRLKEYTAQNTKCMVKVNGITLIERALRILDKKNLSRILIVTGYEGQKLTDYVTELNIHTPLCFIRNEIYDKTNNIYSLALAKEYLIEEDTLLLESDIIFEEALIDLLLDDPRQTLALVDKYASWMDGTCMVLDEDDSIADFIPGKYLKFQDKNSYYKTVNIYKFSRHFSANTYVPFLEAYAKAMGNNEYYESVIKLIALLETKEIKAKRLTGQTWYEIDDIQDLDIAQSLFAPSPEEKYRLISSRYGGYWRYPSLTDFCYLVNPYYPPERMMEEIKSSFDALLTQYPSGMRVNSLLASRNFGVKSSHILTGNGAAELIKALTEQLKGRFGLIRPTFEEYPNRLIHQDCVVFVPDNPDFSYTVDDLTAFFGKKENAVDYLILINPDNPSGNWLSREELLFLISWCRQKNTGLILDESFSDFAVCPSDCDASLIQEEVLDMYDKLYIVKSISKSYGVPGLRLGVLASSDEPLISRLKKQVAIWNINSFGEFYMQISEKYKKDYASSLDKIKKSREILMEGLKEISFLRPIPSQANYIMCQVTGNFTSSQLSWKLLEKNLFIRDLSGKVKGEYIRIAVRTEEDNERLLSELKNLEP